MIATGDEIPGCRWRSRSQTLSKPMASARSMTASVSSIPGPGSASSNRPIVRNPNLRRGSPRRGIWLGPPHGASWAYLPLARERACTRHTVSDRTNAPARRIFRLGRRGDRLSGRLQRLRDDVGHISHRLYVERIENLGGDVVQVGLVALRDEHRLQPGALGRKQFLLDA